MNLTFATANQHKLEEAQAILPSGFDVVPLNKLGHKGELAETTGTIAGNSQQKAESIWTEYQVNCFADDSGLEVDALEGKPGVDTAHYSGNRNAYDNYMLVLKQMKGVTNRAARFVCIITLCIDGKMTQFEGEVKGTIALEPRGQRGFGYDPIFIPYGYEQTLAELGDDVKHTLSHRAMALRAMAAFLSK